MNDATIEFVVACAPTVAAAVVICVLIQWYRAERAWSRSKSRDPLHGEYW